VAQTDGEHEKVHFRREEIAPLESFPSACHPPPEVCRIRRSQLKRWIVWPAALFLSLFLVFSAGLYFIGVDAIGNERLRQQAEQAIEKLAGIDVDVTLGKLQFGLGRSSLFALEVHGARIVRASDKTPVANAGLLRFGLKAIPLLSGRIELARVSMADALLSPAANDEPRGPNIAAILARPVAVAPKTLGDAIFGSIHRAFAITRDMGLNELNLTNIGYLASGQDAPGLIIEELEIERASETELTLEGTARYRGRDLTFSGVAGRNAETNSIEMLSVKISALEEDVGAVAAAKGLVRSLGEFELSLSGREASGSEDGLLRIDMQLGNMLLGFGEDEIPVDRAVVRVAASERDKVFSVIEARVAAGRTLVNFQGTAGPEENPAGGIPRYRIDLVSRNSVLAPTDSPEPPLPFALRLAGRFDPEAMVLSVENLNVRTAEGELAGTASLIMPEGMAPGIKLSLQVDDLPTAHTKQFWPWFAASGAREWVLKNVFGGRVHESELTLDVRPGRLGNGIPLGPDEVFGRFALTGTRFDIAGDIPAVRDGDGWVEFRGTYVKVGLSSGAIYMPSGRRVDASNGTLVLNDAHLKPRIGKLEIDVAGEAPAVIELSSYRPIDASRFHDLTPEDLSGTTSGHISADIPLQAEFPAGDLKWRVALDYEGLSITKPFEGQHITNATGNLLIQPDYAEFAADADLNGVPAKLRIVEPLGASQVERVRHVELSVDDSSREKLFPGLGILISGPFTVVYDREPDEREKISVKLDTAQLTVPWIGWRKGAGIAATADFFMKRDGDTIELTDFSLRGDTFSLAGRMRIADGRLQEAHFDNVRFNRGDDYAATISNTGRRYNVTIKGAAFDARGVIKRVLGENGSSGGGGGSAATAVAVDASLKRVDGFNGESLGQVELDYSFDGQGPDELTVKGATSSYGSVQLTKTAEQGGTIIRAASDNAGAVFRFLDIYSHIQDGQFSLTFQGPNNSDLSGQLDLRNFWVVNEPRLSSLFAASDQSASGQVDASRVQFERGAAGIAKTQGRLTIANGVLRGPLIGSTFQGTLFDADNNMDITGTFMPLYGINRIFGELPLIGQILGNGRDRGLIGITYRLSGKVGSPRLEVNPISAIAPGFLREIFEFR